MIHCEHVWIQYRRQTRLRQTLKNTTLKLFNKGIKIVDFWGLKDISFRVGKGEVMGVIGSNGSGKTSLLKILGGVLKPDRGTIKIDHHVCPLLEVGTGFEQELSGTDNIFLNGAVLGIKKKDLKARYNDIVEFAELESFIDSPLKHYSTGMRMRLGFAIAIHGNPEILLVDEVLAVGDLGFQKKCIDAITELRKRGMTILFVSHSMDTIKHLCTSALWLHAGEAKAQGDVESVVAAYLKEMDHQEKELIEKELETTQPPLECDQSVVSIKSVEFLNQNHKPVNHYHPLDLMIAAIHFKAKEKVNHPIFGVGIHRSDGVHICGPNTGECEYKVDYIEGEGVMEFQISSLKLLSGVYFMTVGIFDSAHIHSYDYRDRAFRFEVAYTPNKGHRGLVVMEYEWNFIRC